MGLAGVVLAQLFRGHRVSWWRASPISERQRVIYYILPSLVCWHLWKARNRVIFEAIKPQSASICEAIFLDIKLLLEGQFKKQIGARIFM